MMLISPAYAQAGAAPGAFDFISLVPLILIFVVFYFLLIRPQQQKVKRHRELIEAIRKGDTVLTGGGIMGHVVRIEDENTLLVEIAKDVRVRIARATIADVMGRPQPANANQAQDQAQGGGKRGKSNQGRGGERQRGAADARPEPEAVNEPASAAPRGDGQAGAQADAAAFEREPGAEASDDAAQHAASDAMRGDDVRDDDVRDDDMRGDDIRDDERDEERRPESVAEDQPAPRPRSRRRGRKQGPAESERTEGAD